MQQFSAPPRRRGAAGPRRLPAAVSLLAVVTSLVAAPLAAAPSLRQIMADPDWIGPPVEAAWWQLDGRTALYRARRPGTERTDLFAIDLAAGTTRRLDFEAQAAIDGERPVFDTAQVRALFVREGSLWLRDLVSGELTLLAGADMPVSRPAFARDPEVVHFQRGGRWWRHDLRTGTARAVADLRLEKAPWESGDSGLEQDQLRLFEALAEEVAEQATAHEEATRAGRLDPGRAVSPWYLGEGSRIVDSSLSADGRWLLAVVEAAKADEGRQDHMPRFVTRSGYVEIEDVRRLVGREPGVPQQLWLLDLDERVKHELDFGALGGIDVDPLAELKQAQGLEPCDADDPRPVRVSAIQWHPSRAVAAVQVQAVDNKDRWLVTVEPGDATVTERHRLTDPAWINWLFNDFGWVGESESLWLLSEESGWSHLYEVDTRSGLLRRVTRGEFEVMDVTPSGDARSALAISNAAHPTQYDLYRIDLASGRMRRLTHLRGVEDYAAHPLTGDVLIRHSGTYVPTQLSLLARDADAPRALTDTRTEDYRAIEWQAPQFVGVPSRHGAGQPIWSKFYPARGGDPSLPRPAVLFVHGAGYTQNTHHKFPYYFREQMFHNLLTQAGYHVLDMDYRASRGYGRDWRTAIYRQMGTPELEDLVDGVAFLVEEHGADPSRIGVYGGSYGGFMTFMAMFKAADTFAAGAALRPVTDWAHYNQPYTSNILNTPQVDPEAYRRSSPIEFVEAFRGHLLISHGMLDDNVFYKDSVRLVQRLIDLEKTDWELASYPLEPHGYVHPQSWLDQYRRIWKLFENTIGAP